MKGRVISIAAEAAVFRQPSVDSSITPEAYVMALGKYVDSAKHNVSLRLFERWMKSSAVSPDITRGEAVLDRFADDLASGRLSGKRSSYTTMARQGPSDIFTLHGRAFAGSENGFLRPLLQRRTYLRLSRFHRLSERTQTALAWFMEKGTVPATKGKAAKPLTAKTRKSSTYAALQLLDILKLSGLEDVTTELLPELSPDDPGFKTTSRILHTASAVYRACVGKGLLPSNPLANVTHSIFESGAKRDFLTPDQLAKLRDLSTLDTRNERQLTDRLVCLLYSDSAVRRDELAGVRLDDVRESNGGYQIVLRSELQKMQNKPTVVIDLLYPETNKLLGLHLRTLRNSSADGALILNADGRPADGPWMAKAIQRESQRLGIKSYYQKLPSPHSLRRTFATCNAKPLGLGMDINEIAVRLRINIQIAFRHYIQENPLLSELKTRAYRKQAGENPLQEASACIEKLAELGFPSILLKPLRLELERRQASFTADQTSAVEWIDEDDVMSKIRHRWNVLPNPRKLRPVFAKQGCTDRRLAHGRIRYRADAVEKFLNEYSAAHMFAAFLPKKDMKMALLDFVTLQIGGIVLLRNSDVSRFIQRVQSLHRSPESVEQLQHAS